MAEALPAVVKVEPLLLLKPKVAAASFAPAIHPHGVSRCFRRAGASSATRCGLALLLLAPPRFHDAVAPGRDFYAVNPLTRSAAEAQRPPFKVRQDFFPRTEA